MFVAGALGTTIAPHPEIVVVMRFVLDFAVGGGSSTVPVFIAEIAGLKRRSSTLPWYTRQAGRKRQ